MVCLYKYIETISLILLLFFRDCPNTWAPHQYIALQALRALPSNVSTGELPIPDSGKSSFDLIPSDQLGLAENQLPQQPKTNNAADGNFTNTGPDADINQISGTVVNGGNTTDGAGSWSRILQRELANRYITSAFCSWCVRGNNIISDLLTRRNQESNGRLN
jgi:alpha,alpha-trehalase